MRRLALLSLIFWLGVGALLGGAAWLASCATDPLPTCAAYQYRLAEDANGEQYRVLDEEDVAQLNALILGLAHGTCRLPTAPSPKSPEQAHAQAPGKGSDV